jgi:hypothetical protein
MKVVRLEKNTLTLPAVAELARTEPVILTLQGKPLAVVKDVSGSDWESVSLANNAQFQALLESARRSFREQGGVGLEELRAELGLKAKPRRARRRKGS